MPSFNKASMLLFPTVLLGLGCSESDEAVPTGIQPSFSQTVSLSQVDVRPGEERFRNMARQVPGFGGYYYDDAGNFVIQLTDPASELLARAAARAELRDLPPQRGSGAIIFRRAEYSFAQLAAWRDEISRNFLEMPGLLSVDADEVRNRVTLGLGDLGRQAEILTSLAKTAIPVNAIAFEQTYPTLSEADTTGSGNLVSSGDIVASAAGTTLTSYFEPVPAGVLITYRRTYQPLGTEWECTMGYAVKSGRVTALRGDSIFFLGASHCSEVQFEPGSTDYYQPSFVQYYLHPEYYLGQERLDPFFFICCVAKYRTRWSDALLADVRETRHLDLGRIAKPTWYSTGRSSGDSGSTTINQSDPRFIVTRKENSVPVGYVIDKVGYVTGWTRGNVNSTCVDRWNANTGYKWLCNTLAYYWSQIGDSGAPVFVQLGGNQVAAVGIHWGGFGSNGGRNGSAIVSPFANIERTAELGPLILP